MVRPRKARIARLCSAACAGARSPCCSKPGRGAKLPGNLERAKGIYPHTQLGKLRRRAQVADIARKLLYKVSQNFPILYRRLYNTHSVPRTTCGTHDRSVTLANRRSALWVTSWDSFPTRAGSDFAHAIGTDSLIRPKFLGNDIEVRPPLERLRILGVRGIFLPHGEQD